MNTNKNQGKVDSVKENPNKNAKSREDDIDMEDEQKKNLSRSAAKSASGQKQKRKKGTHAHNDSQSDKEERHKRRDDKIGHSEEDDLEDEDEDSYDSEEELSNSSFIAPEEVVEQELLEWKQREEEELGMKGKKKKRKKSFRLEEEDIDLIQTNTGLQLKKRRLVRHSEKEKGEEGLQVEVQKEAQQRVKFEGTQSDPDEQQFQQHDQPVQDLLERKHSHKQSSHVRPPLRGDDLANYEQDHDKVRQAQTIFNDAQVLRDEINHRQKQGKKEEGEVEDDGLEGMFDGNEIDDQFATKADDIIAQTDIPERLQIKLVDRLDPKPQELEDEAKWIFDRLEQEKKTQYDSDHQIIKKKIQDVLDLFRNHFLDIPMIIKYRRFIYQKELDEDDIQMIFNLDQEYGKFTLQKDQIINFLKNVQQFDPDMRVIEEELKILSKGLHELNFYSPLIAYLKSYYNEELQSQKDDPSKKKNPLRSDKIQLAKKYRLDQFTRECMLKPIHFIENLQHLRLKHRPKEPEVVPFNLAHDYFSDYYNEEIKIFSGVCEFASLELAAQPYIRQLMKSHFYENAHLSTTPTEKGMKDIDPFHPSYRVKRIDKAPLFKFNPRYIGKGDGKFSVEKNFGSDLFMDILANEKNGLINIIIQVDKDTQIKFYEELGQHYFPIEDKNNQWNIMRKEVLRRLYESVLYPDMIKEAKVEMREVAENFIIKEAQEKYKQLLMTGPFDCQDQRRQHQPGQTEEGNRSKSRSGPKDEEIVKEKPRYNVMSVILQQIDRNNHMVTVAVVDKYGELVAHKDFMHLMPPRKAPQRQEGPEVDEERQKKIQLSNQEEVKEHEADKTKVQELMHKHSVDLIVIGANKLEARILFKDVFQKIAESMKSYGQDNDDQDDEKWVKKRDNDDQQKEAFVIWGSLEIPKLFSCSHKSQKLLKSCHHILKQAVSLARYEQDPMCEILNLWSSVPSENQTLSLGLHPLQKLVNQSKFAQALEDINIKCVNEVGIDLNTLLDHEHMQCLLQFISGLGPRKAKRLMMNMGGRKAYARKDFIVDTTLMGRNCFISAIAFLRIKVPTEESKNYPQDYLDLTRIHCESYPLTHKIISDMMSNQNQDQVDDLAYGVKYCFKNPNKLGALDWTQYQEELKQIGQQNMIPILDIIREELYYPFKDPRQARSPNKINIPDSQLFYMLIDESDRTFKRGVIITATVVRILEKKVLCKLDNGLDGIIFKEDICNENEDLEKIIQTGHVITGRIDKISNEEDSEKKRFSVTLKCKRSSLERHDEYVDRNVVHPDDLVNHNFQIQKRASVQGKYVNRRINHPKFKNISSGKAQLELADKDIGDYIFRPSSKGENNITLTWKFYVNNIVHIDIKEENKPIGASIGNTLMIHDEKFENLQEIVERYIIPCNRGLREVINHGKFVACTTEAELAQILKNEKNEDVNRIPYKFTILSDYPQHVVLAYIAKADKIDKEYIKIKPRGYYFHDKFHNPFQALIDWYKQNFRSREYQKIKSRYDKRPPIAKAVLYQPNEQIPANSPRHSTDMDWQPAAGGGSVHSLNDGKSGDNMKTEYQYTSNTVGRSSAGQEMGGGSSRWGATTGAQFSEYNQNNQSSMADSDQPRGRGRGGSVVCYNCQQPGHMSRECPQEKKPSYARGQRGGGDREDRGDRGDRGDRQDRGGDRYDRGDRQDRGGDRGGYHHSNRGDREESKNNRPSASENAWGSSGAGADQNFMKSEIVSKSPGGWGNTAPEVQQPNKSPGAAVGWDANPADAVAQVNTGGWGQKTPQRNDGGFGNSGWDNNANDNGGGNWNAGNNDGGGDSPARSQRSFDGGRGRGRGRGRGGPPGGGRECFKCHQEGHMARECPNAGDDQRPPRDGGGRGGPRTCFKCQQEGHMARECPNPPSDNGEGRGRGRGRGRGDGGDRPRGCFKCHQEGHMARECPNDDGAGNDRPYKRQRRDDAGGSYRRDNDDNNNNNNNNGGGNWNSSNDQVSGGNQWGGAGGWDAAATSNAQANSQQEPPAWNNTSSSAANDKPQW